MKRVLATSSVLGILLFTPVLSRAQLSGSYTIGGHSPDYTTFAEAVASLEASGVSGSVEFLVRPGVYEEAGGTERVVDIANPVPGASDANAITFRPDPAAGASSENIILRRSSGVTDGGSDGYIARIRSGFVHLEKLTFVVADSSFAPTDHGPEHVGPVIEFEYPGIGLTNAVSLSGSVIEGFEGRCFLGVGVNGAGRDVRIVDNHIRDCRDAIGVYGGTAENALVSGNEIRGLRRWFSGQSEWRGDGIRVQGSGSGMTVSGNDIEYDPWTNGGVRGIVVQGTPKNILVEGNRVAGNRVGGSFGSYTNMYIREADGGLIANNMLTSAATTSFGRVNIGLYLLTTQNLKVLHNTVNLGASGGRAIHLDGTGHEIVDNILANVTGPSLFIGDGQSAQNVFDYNVLHSGSPTLVREGFTTYATLEAWQQTGNGQNSVQKLPEFRARLSDLHLADCSVEDESLRGTPQPEVMLDYDGELRDLFNPFIGMDEAAGEVPDLFGVPSNYASGKSSWRFASGDLDGDGDQDLAVSNTPSGSDDVTVLWNDGSGVFSSPTHLNVGSDPGVVKIAYMDNDNIKDLVVSVT
ncbi:MAG: right-handed parallel beta-helix repeat-containing protein, partial [Rhodothermales bacterium]|nr:right-handed parallel beta-helix repeat-containing protein [Rhodothermales bacterium]